MAGPAATRPVPGQRAQLLEAGLKISAFVGLIGVAFSWILWLTALSLEQASVLAPVRGLVVPFGFAFSILIVKERPTKKAFLGLVLILAG